MSAVLNVSDRLHALPRKVSMPLSRLLESEHISTDVLEGVLDAGELAGNRDWLLGFAVSYLHMQAQGVPVRDVIRMARAQRRRVKLSWSPRRWREEHDRLSRAETLIRLREQNVTYDVARYTPRLPERFSGYVIRTSRRLGMEGLRQRHCVASYHDMLVSGYSAIVVVFVDRRRWTVQIAETSGDCKPLRIVQIRGKRNEVPSAEVRERIHEMLDIPSTVAVRQYASAPARRHMYLENLRRVLPVLRQHGVDNVEVSFDGCGDSGSIDRVEFEGAELDRQAIGIELEGIYQYYENGEYRSEQTLRQLSLEEAIKEIAQDYLEETGVNWYDNDGGFGELTIDVVAGTVSLEVNVRTSSSDVEYQATKDIETGESVDE